MDRSIPHVRDIFSSRQKSGDPQELCLYDKSPRSRRRLKDQDKRPADYIDVDHRIGGKERDPPVIPSPQSGGWKRDDVTDKENHHLSLEDSKHDSDRRNNRNNNQSYSSKTLTERDIRHLERHLSMKKTIRKQISRNLAQAFVDDPKLLDSGSPEMNVPSVTPPTEKKQDYGITLTRAKMAKSEQNVLDMLKVSVEERDSGHSSPTNDALDDEEDEDIEKNWRAPPASLKYRNNQPKSAMEGGAQKDYGGGGDKKSSSSSSIWKMFSPRNKGKR